MKNRIDYQEDISKSIERIPFLKRFLMERLGTNSRHETIGLNFSSQKILDYLGVDYHIVTDGAMMSGELNKVLEIAEKRGDL